MNYDELRNALSDVKSMQISVDEFILLTKLKNEQKPASFEDEPFFHGCHDTIANYRRHLLKALGFKQAEEVWISLEHHITINKEFIKGANETEFFEAISEYIKE